MRNKLSSYPTAYSRLLLSLPSDGSPIEIQLSHPDIASQERSRFYNFLKYLRRNPSQALHFGNRHNEVVIYLKHDRLRFQLERIAQADELETGLDAAITQLNLPAANLPDTILTAPPQLDAPAIGAEQQEPELNLLDMFLAAEAATDTTAKEPS